jgi:hypothetical protein
MLDMLLDTHCHLWLAAVLCAVCCALQVCPCICFCAYVEEQLQVMHDNAEVITARIVQEQQSQEQQAQEQQQHNGLQQQQPEQPLANGNHASQDELQQWPSQQQQQQPRASANGLTHRQSRVSDGAALAAVVAAASTKLRVLARPISEFSSCRREWVLKLGKAVAMGFMQKAAGGCVQPCAVCNLSCV